MSRQLRLHCFALSRALLRTNLDLTKRLRQAQDLCKRTGSGLRAASAHGITHQTSRRPHHMPGLKHKVKGAGSSRADASLGLKHSWPSVTCTWTVFTPPQGPDYQAGPKESLRALAESSALGTARQAISRRPRGAEAPHERPSCLTPALAQNKRKAHTVHCPLRRNSTPDIGIPCARSPSAFTPVDLPARMILSLPTHSTQPRRSVWRVTTETCVLTCLAR